MGGGGGERLKVASRSLRLVEFLDMFLFSTRRCKVHESTSTLHEDTVPPFHSRRHVCLRELAAAIVPPPNVKRNSAPVCYRLVLFLLDV